MNKIGVGRALDTLIVEELFGWNWHTVAGINLLLPPGHDLRNRPMLATPGRHGEEDDIDSRLFVASDHLFRPMPIVPAFSTDVQAALMIQAEMHRRGFWMELRSSFDRDGGKHYDGWWGGFTPHLTTGWNGRPDHSTQGATAAAAICLAALATICDNDDDYSDEWPEYDEMDDHGLMCTCETCIQDHPERIALAVHISEDPPGNSEDNSQS